MEIGEGSKKAHEEEVGITAAEEDNIGEDEVFQRSLAAKLWTDSPFNARAFKQTMIQAWRLKNPVETQDLNRNLFLFRFTSKKDADSVLRNGPWSFDRNLLILQRISGEEQPADLEMHRVSFWVRVYELPLKLRSESMGKKLGDFVGVFEEIDPKEANRNGKFLRIKVSIDLRNPLKRGTVINYQGRRLKVNFKYERLPTFCFGCGRIGHQLKDCEEVEGQDDASYEEVDEKELGFGPWLRASPLPKATMEQRKESSSGTCSKSLFASSSHSRCEDSTVMKEKGIEVDQTCIIVKKGSTQELQLEKRTETQENTVNEKAVEYVAESLGNVALSKKLEIGTGSNRAIGGAGRTWVRKKAHGAKKQQSQQTKKLQKELGKRQLIEVAISEGSLEELKGVEKKRRQDIDMVDKCDPNQTVVLENQHHREQ